MRTLIIADDLTGALDVAGPFAQRGVGTRVVVGADQEWATHMREATVVSVNANTRHMPAAQAADRISTLMAQSSFQEGVLIKKIDSTLRGQVVAETIAMLRASGRGVAIVAPAFPAQGRTVQGGIVHVGGVPLVQTAFARDALSPPPLEPIEAVFRRQGMRCVSTMPSTLSSIAAEGHQVIVVDARSDEDLIQTATGMQAHVDNILWVGSAGIAQAIASSQFSSGTCAEKAKIGARRVLIVVGSRAEQSALQVQHLMARPDVFLLDAPNGVADNSSLESCTSPVILLRAVADVHGEGDAEHVAASLAVAAAKVIKAHRIDAVIATGGDTARAILRALSAKVLDVKGDLLPGIPYSNLAFDSRPVWLVTKAGGFGGREALDEIVTYLLT